MKIETIEHKYIKTQLAGDATDLTYVLANNIEKTQFIHDCINIACEMGYINTVKSLLNCKALYYNTDGIQFYYACKGGNSEIITIVEEACIRTYHHRDKIRHTYRCYIETLDKFNIHLWSYGIRGACNGGNLDIIKRYTYLNPVICNIKFWDSCWVYACGSDNVDVVNFIIDQGISRVSRKISRHEYWNIGLKVAMGEECINIVKLMLKKGANLWVPLYLHANPWYVYNTMRNDNNWDEIGHYYKLNFLCPEHSDYNFTKGLYSLCKNGDYEAVRSAISKGITDWNEGLRGACEEPYAKYEGSYIKIIELMIQNGADNINDCLMRACYRGLIVLVKILIEYNINCHNRNIDWNEGLKHTCAGNYRSKVEYVEIVKLMITNGATNYNCGLSFARNERFNQDKNVSKLLVSKGAEYFYNTGNSTDFKLHILYCNFSKIDVSTDDRFHKLLVKYPPYVLLLSKTIKIMSGGGRGNRNIDCHVWKLPAELFRLLFDY